MEPVFPRVAVMVMRELERIKGTSQRSEDEGRKMRTEDEQEMLESSGLLDSKSCSFRHERSLISSQFDGEHLSEHRGLGIRREKRRVSWSFEDARRNQML